jgi:hypothetical protein
MTTPAMIQATNDFHENANISPSIFKIRVSAHPLNIETGRYKNIIRSERKCTNCSEEDIEDEKHFVVDCPLYENIRVKFFDKVIDLCLFNII